MLIITSKTKGSKRKAIEAYNRAEAEGEELWRKRERVNETIFETAQHNFSIGMNEKDYQIAKVHPKLAKEFNEINQAAHAKLDEAAELFKKAKEQESLA